MTRNSGLENLWRAETHAQLPNLLKSVGQRRVLQQCMLMVFCMRLGAGIELLIGMDVIIACKIAGLTLYLSAIEFWQVSLTQGAFLFILMFLQQAAQML